MRLSVARKPGPQRVVDALYRKHVGDVYRYALAVMGEPADAEDVTQTTFLNAFRALERGDEVREPKAWLRAIAHNVCRQRFRQLSRRPNEVPFDEDAGEFVEEQHGPTAEDVARALKHLPSTSARRWSCASSRAARRARSPRRWASPSRRPRRCSSEHGAACASRSRAA